MVLAGIIPVGKWVIKIGGVCSNEERPSPGLGLELVYLKDKSFLWRPKLSGIS